VLVRIMEGPRSVSMRKKKPFKSVRRTCQPPPPPAFDIDSPICGTESLWWQSIKDPMQMTGMEPESGNR
jgi:hypothetical protein